MKKLLLAFLLCATTLFAAQQNINIGSSGGDGTGDTLRSGGAKINANFTELYARPNGNQTITITGDASGSGTTSITVTIPSLSWSKITGAPTTLSGYGITDASPLAGSSSITTLGTITSGTWHGTAIGDTYIASAATWNAKQNALTAGTDYLAPNGNGSGLTGLTKSQVGLGNVEDTALSTWGGTINLTTLGTVTAGTWNATAVAVAHGGTGSTSPAAATVALTPASSAISASAIDWSASSSFYKTLAANTTFTFSNVADGQTIVVALTNTASNYTVTWPTVTWVAATAPTQTTGAHTDIYTFVRINGVTYGNAVQNF